MNSKVDLERAFNRVQTCKRQISILKKTLTFWQKELHAALDALGVQYTLELDEVLTPKGDQNGQSKCSVQATV